MLLEIILENESYDSRKVYYFDKEQELFEKWWAEKYTPHKLGRIQTMGGDISSEYKDSRVQYAFNAWLARAQMCV